MRENKLKNTLSNKIWVLILSVIWIIFLATSNNIVMAQSDINWAAYQTSMKTGSTTNIDSITGTYADAFDGNDNTYYYGYRLDYSGNVKITMVLQSNFTSIHSINRMRAVYQGSWPPPDTIGSYGQVVCSGCVNGFGSYSMEVYYNNNWNIVSSGSLVRDTKIIIDLPNLFLPSVSKTRLIVNVSAQHTQGHSLAASIYTYELSAWGPDYIDIGLRAYDGANIIKVACEPEGTLTSPLRIRKGSTTYGIVLVDSSDLNASKIRIKTNSGIKALARFE